MESFHRLFGNCSAVVTSHTLFFHPTYKQVLPCGQGVWWSGCVDSIWAMWHRDTTFVPFPTWRCHHPLPLLEEAGLEAISRTKVVCLVSRHQFLHWLQNHTQLVGIATRQSYRMEMVWILFGGGCSNRPEHFSLPTQRHAPAAKSSSFWGVSHQHWLPWLAWICSNCWCVEIYSRGF